MFEGKKVLVTGGAGFLGSDIAGKLLAEGALVVVIDNLFRGKLSNLQTFFYWLLSKNLRDVLQLSTRLVLFFSF